MPDLDLARLAPEAFARAASAAFVADVARSPSLERAIRERTIDANGLKNLILRDLSSGVQASPGSGLFPNLRNLVQTEIDVGEHRLTSGLSQFDFGGLVNAVGAIAVGAINYSAAQSAQRAQLQSQQLAVQMAQIQADTAMTQLAAQQGLPSSISSILPAEISSALSNPIAVALLAAAVGGGIIYMIRR